MSTPYEKEHIRMLSAIVKNLELMNVHLEDIKTLILRQNEILEDEDEDDFIEVEEVDNIEEEENIDE